MQSEELSPEELSSLLGSYMPEIPGYRVIRRIGKGGMSYVYLGVQVSLDRQVAIKVMSPEALTDEKSKQRFEQEAHTIAKLEHPCIVGVHEVGRTPQGLLYYVLPYLARGHLGQRDFTNDEGRIIEVLRALLSALEYAHTRGIVHRDVKAENVLFDNADRPLLTDFGIALKRNDTSRITTAGLAIGSGGYMAPEQARGEAVDGRADLYSVGVLAYELLTGRLPYQSSDPLGLALMHAQDPIPRLPAHLKHWQLFLDRSMAKSPDNRFRNAQQMLGMLNQISAKERVGTAEPEPGGIVPERLPLMSRPWMKPALVSVTAGALVLIAAMLLRPDKDKAPASQDFYTGKAPGPAPAVVVVPAASAIAPSPAVVDAGSVAAAASSGAAASNTAAVLPPVDGVADAASAGAADAVVPLPPPVTSPAPVPVAAGQSLYAAVVTSVTVDPLHFDPTQPGARELRAVDRQIKQNRLSTPPGDNAVDSLLAATKAGAPLALLDPPAEKVFAAFGTGLAANFRAGDLKAAEATYKRAQAFAAKAARLQTPAWKKFRDGLPALMNARLNKVIDAGDATALALTRSLARTMDLDPKLLEPAWSREIALQQPGRPAAGPGPSTVMIVPASGGRPGVAFMREEVSRADYSAFASRTGRAAAKCKNRLAPISFKKRSWDSPGFEQSSSHPAVCISYEDARAYASWLSERTGETFRLPTAAEWHRIASYSGSGNACLEGRVSCGQEGTVPTAQGPASPLGLLGVKGNAKEWLADCAGSCKAHLVGGLGWRDSASRAEGNRTSGLDANLGFDDVGFRLVREVPAR
ncbi:MAG: bifunctional serine/threonine-protein kinase/formylglycine-generating enzyme family protein [Arenimonas sp.]